MRTKNPDGSAISPELIQNWVKTTTMSMNTVWRYKAVATDNEGNTAEAYITVKFDNVAPQNYNPFSYQFDGTTKLNLNMFVIDK